MRHTIKVYNITETTELKPNRRGAYGYIFYNNGETTVNITVNGSGPIQLVPGAFFDSRNNGTLDLSTYLINFFSSNTAAITGQQSNLNITAFERA